MHINMVLTAGILHPIKHNKYHLHHCCTFVPNKNSFSHNPYLWCVCVLSSLRESLHWWSIMAWDMLPHCHLSSPCPLARCLVTPLQDDQWQRHGGTSANVWYYVLPPAPTTCTTRGSSWKGSERQGWRPTHASVIWGWSRHSTWGTTLAGPYLSCKTKKWRPFASTLTIPPKIRYVPFWF